MVVQLQFGNPIGIAQLTAGVTAVRPHHNGRQVLPAVVQVRAACASISIEDVEASCETMFGKHVERCIVKRCHHFHDGILLGLGRLIHHLGFDDRGPSLFRTGFEFGNKTFPADGPIFVRPRNVDNLLMQMQTVLVDHHHANDKPASHRFIDRLGDLNLCLVAGRPISLQDFAAMLDFH